MKGLSGKVAVVTGSTEGIGFAIAERLGEEGVKVVVSSRTDAKVKAAVEKLQDKNVEVFGAVCDVTKKQDVQQLIEKALVIFGGIDYLVLNANSNEPGYPILQASDETWNSILETNLTSSVNFVKQVAPRIKQRGGGSILFISSVAGYGVVPVLGSYAVSKAGVLTLTKQLSAELAGDNIRVNCVAPGATATKVYAPLLADESLKPMLDVLTAGVTMKRLAQPEEIAGPAAFLLSDDASYITGEVLCVGGGIHTRL